VEPSAESNRTVHVFPEPRIEKVEKGSRAPKLSVSLYQYDIDRLDTIKDFMKSQGFRNLSDSEALRLACRKVAIDGSLIDVYKSMQSEDGRRK
jgi:3-phenylpropionate/cinnamic acid dioxygenase small subunit